MTKNNMPDEISVCGVSDWLEVCPRGEPDAVAFIRKGARTQFIDPKVQPIPDWVENGELLYAKWLTNGNEWRATISCSEAQIYEKQGRLLGYVILPL